jgi:hypothetical protein
MIYELEGDPGVNLTPRGEICPQGKCSPLHSPPGVNTLSLLLRRMEGRTENITPRDNFTHRIQNSPLGDNFAPGGQSLPLEVKLRMGLWRRGVVDIASASGTRRTGFESCQGIRFLGKKFKCCCV